MPFTFIAYIWQKLVYMVKDKVKVKAILRSNKKESIFGLL